MRETRLSGSEGGGANPIASPYPYPVKVSSHNRRCEIPKWPPPGIIIDNALRRSYSDRARLIEAWHPRKKPYRPRLDFPSPENDGPGQDFITRVRRSLVTG
jgi:hypothetical protein